MSSRVRAATAANCAIFRSLSSALMVVLGVGITVSAMASVQIRPRPYHQENLVPFVTVILLGLFLGMRHSTDPDHVVAVSTIVSRQGSIKSSATIGLLWGWAHTDDLPGWVRNHHFRRGDPAPARAVAWSFAWP